MKSLENFQNEKIEIKSIWGGGEVETSRPDTKDAHGCTVITTDSYNDANGNKKLDANENCDVCVEIKC